VVLRFPVGVCGWSVALPRLRLLLQARLQLLEQLHYMAQQPLLQGEMFSPRLG